jgi:cyclophilin family peptidyl-prolyl cis-trans isomerase
MTDASRSTAEHLRELTTPPAVGDPLGRVLARAARQDGRRRWTTVAAAVAATTLAATGAQVALDTPPQPTADSDVVPWRLQLAGPESFPAFRETGEPGLASCTANQMSVRADEAVTATGDGAVIRAGTVTVPVTITNEGQRCQLPAEADGLVVDGSGAPLSAALSVRGLPGYSSPPALEAGASASTVVRWSSWCGPDVGDWGVSVRLAGATAVASVPGQAAPPPCTSSDDGAIVGGGLWQLLNEFGQPLRDPRGALRGTLTAPDRARLGDTLKMVLRLENPSKGPVRLDPCPYLGWAMDQNPSPGLTATGAVFRLNCEDAPEAVPAGGAVSFALELPLSPALSDCALAPGRWSLRAETVGNPTAVSIDIEAGAPAPSGENVACTYVATARGPGRVPGLPAGTGPRVPAAAPQGQAVLSTDRGTVVVELDTAASPCAVRSFAHHVQGGYWEPQPCYGVAAETRFRNVDCGSVDVFYGSRAGYLFPAETTTDMDYPAGTVVLTSNDAWTNTGTIRVLTAPATTYANNFTILGRVVEGLEVMTATVAAGVRPGTNQEPVLPLTIRSITLR